MRLPSRLQARVRGIDARAERGVDLDAVFAQCVAEHSREAADGAVDGGLRKSAFEQRALDVVQMSPRDLRQRAVFAAGKVGVDVGLDPVAVRLDRPRVPSDAATARCSSTRRASGRPQARGLG